MSTPPPPTQYPIVVYGVSGPSGHAPADYLVTDCAIYADSKKGVGILCSSGDQAALKGVLGNLPPNAVLPDPAGVCGEATNQNGVLGISYQANGVVGKSWNGIGVVGTSDGYDGMLGLSKTGIGIVGVSNQYGPAVVGYAFGSTGNGVFGSGSVGVSGGGSKYGVQGSSSSPAGIGVLGFSNSGVGVVGDTATGKAGRFHGDVDVTGTLTKAGLAFKIDHPLDPANKYLYHSGVESPDMKNVYDGVVRLDDAGDAVIDLPDWFEALNGDFRYQLTPIGRPAPDLHIAEGINRNRFRISGGPPRTQVCWQVTGIRQDAWARGNRVPVEQNKPRGEKGQYLHPQAHNKPRSKDVFATSARDEQDRADKELEKRIRTLREREMSDTSQPRKARTRRARSR